MQAHFNPHKQQADLKTVLERLEAKGELTQPELQAVLEGLRNRENEIPRNE